MDSVTQTSRSLPESWQVHLPIFEGPLDLLLHLIKINEVEISDIPVSLICDQFHEYLSLMEELDLDIASDYLYEAAQLIQLKSRMLLPRPKADDAGTEEDPREELVERLLEYKKLKEAAQTMAERHALRQGIWTRAARPPVDVEDDLIDFSEVSINHLLGAFKNVLERFDRDHPPPYLVHREVFSVREQFERLLERLDPAKPLDFADDLRLRSGRGEVVAAFLAILELARLALVRIHQADNGAILLYRTPKELAREDLEGIRV